MTPPLPEKPKRTVDQLYAELSVLSNMCLTIPKKELQDYLKDTQDVASKKFDRKLLETHSIKDVAQNRMHLLFWRDISLMIIGIQNRIETYKRDTHQQNKTATSLDDLNT